MHLTLPFTPVLVVVVSLFVVVFLVLLWCLLCFVAVSVIVHLGLVLPVHFVPSF